MTCAMSHNTVGIISVVYNPIFDGATVKDAQDQLYTNTEMNDLCKIFDELGPFTATDEELREGKLADIKAKIISTWIARGFSATPLVR